MLLNEKYLLQYIKFLYPDDNGDLIDKRVKRFLSTPENIEGKFATRFISFEEGKLAASGSLYKIQRGKQYFGGTQADNIPLIRLFIKHGCREYQRFEDWIIRF